MEIAAEVVANDGMQTDRLRDAKAEFREQIGVMNNNNKKTKKQTKIITKITQEEQKCLLLKNKSMQVNSIDSKNWVLHAENIH